MRRHATVAFLLLTISLWAVARYAHTARAQAQQQQQSQQQSQQPAKQTVKANPTGSVADQLGEPAHASSPQLNCQECHGQGRTLPYLGGGLFHKDAHAAYDTSFHSKALQSGKRAATCLDCHTTNGDMTTMLPRDDPRSTVSRANIAQTCGKCHGAPGVMQGSGITNRPFLSYRESVHGHALAQGKQNAAVCTDCHRNHDILPASDARSPIFKFNIPQTCGQCHSNIASDYAQSVHGQAAKRGVSQTPVCTDCHGIHSIMPRDAARFSLRSNTCAKCHDGVRLTQEFGVAGDRVQSYENSYHGLAHKLGSSVAADCASCHGVHNILPSSNPRSMIAAANLTQTCGQCHPGAGENFARGRIHLDTPVSRDAATVGVRYVRWFYVPVILLTIGGMALHNALAWRKKAAARLRREPRTFARLTRNQRAQHWLLLTSFVVLVVSGFALVYQIPYLQYLGLGLESTRRVIHRIAAILMLCVGLYHLAYLSFTREGRRWVADMTPTRQDAKDVLQFFRHHLGFRVERPKFGRFGYAEKAEYWAVIWGTLVMGLTGLMIWFKLSIFGWLPRWWVDIAIAVHFYEAVLATLAIVVWHFYHVVFDPDVYPVNLAFYDGRVSERLYEEEHEADYERMKRDEEACELRRDDDDGRGVASPLPGAAGD